jgi:acetolactate synthase I/II/III large subunit
MAPALRPPLSSRARGQRKERAMKQYCDGGEAILEAFRSLGVDYIISSPGSEWSPVWEALARQKVNQQPGPRYIDCWHETLAVDMAMGYTAVTGHPQAVLLHAGAGLLQGSAGLHSARLAEVPMVVLSGESTSFGEDPALPIEPQWYHSLSIVGGPQRLVEPVTKFATQAGNVHALYEHVVRAGELAQRPPKGPVYLNVPLEVMLQPWTPPANPRAVPPAPALRPADRDIERIAELLIAAKNPVVIADASGRNPAAFAALAAFADCFAIPVGSRRFAAFANFPKTHALWLGQAIDPFLDEADLVLLVGSKAPWYPPSRRPRSATIVAIDENPLKGTMVYQSIEADHYLEGNVAASLDLLVAAAKASGFRADPERRARWRREHERVVAAERAAEEEVGRGERIDPLTLAGALRAAMPPDTIWVEETITHAGLLQQHLPWDRPQSFFRAGGGLGQGLGMALGIKLAAPERPVAALLGDGSFLYNPVVQALGASKGAGLPILVVVCNNGSYRAMRVGHLHHYPDGAAREADLWHGVAIDGPDYAELGHPFGFHGEKVEKPAALPDAIRNAMRAVSDGRTAILNVLLSR